MTFVLAAGTFCHTTVERIKHRPYLILPHVDSTTIFTGLKLKVSLNKHCPFHLLFSHLPFLNSCVAVAFTCHQVYR